MKPRSVTNRRNFLMQSTMLTAAGGALNPGALNATGTLNTEAAQSVGAPGGPMDSFSEYQQRRRQALWGLLGDLPWPHQPAPPKVIRTEEHETYTLERLVLDLNG